MLEEEGVVKEIQGDMAIILTLRKAECEECASRGACEILGQSREVKARVLNPVGALPGQRVKVMVPEKILLKSTFYLYFLPALSFMVGAFSGYFLSGTLGFNPDLCSIVGGGTGLIASFTGVFYLNRFYKNKDMYLPRIVEILGEEPQDD